MLTYDRVSRSSRAGSRLASLGLACTLFFTATQTHAAWPVSLPRTGQTLCYNGANLAACTGSGQDGEKQEGVAWPASRFRSNADDTFTDLLTGITWAKDAEAPGPGACSPGTTKSWKDALAYVKCLNLNNWQGKNDWRLPNIVELRSLFTAEPIALDPVHPDVPTGSPADWLNNLNLGIRNLRSTSQDRYKSSTPGVGAMATTPWTISFYDGATVGYYHGSLDHVWPVRSETAPGAVQLPQTGVTQCYDLNANSATVISCSNASAAGQDGQLKVGVAWPGTRFAVGTDSIVDNLTGLEWVKDGKTQNFGSCSGGPKKWLDALSFVDCLNSNSYLGKNDWRAPNLYEMLSLTSAGGDLGTWPTGFTLDLNLQLYQYWTSTTYLVNSAKAWAIAFGSVGGSSTGVYKDSTNYLIPVRNASTDQTAPVTSVDKPGATYPSAQTITLSSDETGTVIYYTTDGSAPTTGSLHGPAPVTLTVSGSKTIRFFGVDAVGNTETTIHSAVYVIGSTPGPSYKRGDINKDGAIDIVDAQLAYAFYTQSQTPTAEQLTQADVVPLLGGTPVGDGQVQFGDVVAILRHVIGVETW